jgi:adenylate cyclase
MDQSTDGKPAAGDTPRCWRFGEVRLDESSLKLEVRGRPVELERKPLEVLLHLLRHAGKMVTKDDLIKAIWPGRILSDSALTSTVAQLREALGDEGDAIKTVHGFGYRLEAEIRADAAAARGRDAEGDRAQPSRRLAAIMFTDLVGYSALAHKDEALAIELLELHRQWIREILPKHGGIEIETVGDAFLIEFAGALAAVECAVAIQQRFADSNAMTPEARRMQLRIGIHLGDVEHKDGKVFGDGVNIAARIHGMTAPGGICVSEQVHYSVRNRAGLQFRSLGSPALKNITTPLELFSLAGEGVTPAPPARGSILRRLAAPVAVAGALALVAVGAWRFVDRPRDAATPSIAVLPFENLSDEPDSGYFTEGLHDTVIGHLARIKGLKVVSRTSVLEFRGQQANLRNIARVLDVANVVEGSVQRVGGRLRVVAQLIQVDSDAHLWSAEYDRDLVDVFAVQADVAEQIAAAVRVQLTPEVRARIQAVPTHDLRAYDLYLKALQTRQDPGADRRRLFEAVAGLEEAIGLDPGFAQAHALLAFIQDNLYWTGIDTSEERSTRARDAAQTALRLDPALPEAHVASALHVYHVGLRFDEAARLLEGTLELTPGNAEAHELLGFVYARLGRADESLGQFRQAIELDPRNVSFLYYYAVNLMAYRRLAEGERAFRRVLEVAPDFLQATLDMGAVRFVRTGSLQEWRQALEAAARLPESGCTFALSRASFARYESRHADALASLANCREDEAPTVGGSGFAPRELPIAEAHWWAGNGARAHEFAAIAVKRVREQLVQRDHPQMRVLLAMGLALAGDAAAAIREMEGAAASSMTQRDTLLRGEVLNKTAWLYAFLRKDDAALDALERSLQAPWGLLPNDVKASPEWRPYLGNPRFVELLEREDRAAAGA